MHTSTMVSQPQANAYQFGAILNTSYMSRVTYDRGADELSRGLRNLKALMVLTACGDVQAIARSICG